MFTLLTAVYIINVINVLVLNELKEMAAKFFKKKYPTINESTVRTVAKKYDENVKVAKACGQSPDRKLKT